MNLEEAYIGIGSNMGNRVETCRKAIEEIRLFPNTTAIRVSSLYETAPVEVENQAPFINAVAAIHTKLSAHDLFAVCQKAEQKLGRKHTIRYGPRIIDLDILVYGQSVMRTDLLTLPHPKLHFRRFVLVPLVEIAPKLIHPALHRTMAELLTKLQDNHSVRCLSSSPTALQ